MEKRIVNTKEYVDVLRSLTEEGKEVSMLIAGGSMSPYLVHGRDSICFRAPERPLRRGDMVFYQRAGGQYVMHRICRVRPEGYYLVGDAQTEIEGPVSGEQIFARVYHVKRKGKDSGPGEFWWEFFEHVWIRVVPARRILMKIYGAVSRLFRPARRRKDV